MSQPRLLASVRVFIFTQAGAGPSTYNALQRSINKQDGFEAIVVCLPGRGPRPNEKAPTSVMEGIIKPLLEDIRPLLNEKPYLLLGHGYGAIQAYALALEAKRAGLPLPLGCVFASRNPPDHQAAAPTAEEVTAFIRICTPPSVHDDTDLMARLQTLYSRDFETDASTCLTSLPDGMISVPFVLCRGSAEEDVQLKGWDKYTYKKCEVLELEGANSQWISQEAAQEAVIAALGRLQSSPTAMRRPSSGAVKAVCRTPTNASVTVSPEDLFKAKNASVEKNYGCKWLGCFLGQTKPAAAYRVFLFCPAGANAAFFTPLVKKINAVSNMEAICICMPGRGTRTSEPLATQLQQDIVTPLVNEISFLLQEKPYFLLGHSFGALVAHAVAVEAQKRGLRMPLRSIIASRHPPDWKGNRALHEVTDEELTLFISQLGTPASILQNPDLLKTFLALVRVDITANATVFSAEDPANVVNVPYVVCSGGPTDDIPGERKVCEITSLWGRFTKGAITERHFEAGHYWISAEKNQDALLEMLKKWAV